MKLTWNLSPKEKEEVDAALNNTLLTTVPEWAEDVKQLRAIVLSHQSDLVPFLDNVLKLVDYSPMRTSIICKVQAIMMVVARLNMNTNSLLKATTKKYKLDFDSIPSEFPNQLQKVLSLRKVADLQPVLFPSMPDAHHSDDSDSIRVLNSPAQGPSNLHMGSHPGRYDAPPDQDSTMASILSAIHQEQLLQRQQIAAIHSNSSIRQPTTLADMLNMEATTPPGDSPITLSHPQLHYHHDKWYPLGAESPANRHILMTRLHSLFSGSQNKLNHQKDILLELLDLIIQDDLEATVKLICDRLHFLKFLDQHTLQQAVHYWSQLRGENRPTRFKAAECSTQLLAASHSVNLRQAQHYTHQQGLAMKDESQTPQEYYPNDQGGGLAGGGGRRAHHDQTRGGRGGRRGRGRRQW